jgi:hypothetical protein
MRLLPLPLLIVGCAQDELRPAAATPPLRPECVPQEVLRCDGARLLQEDGCGESEVVDTCCAGCANGACVSPTPTYDACVGADVWTFDNCDQPVLEVATCCVGCVDGACRTPAVMGPACHGEDVWTFDECGDRVALVETCCAGCGEGACREPAPAYTRCVGSNIVTYDDCDRAVSEVICCAGCTADDACTEPVVSYEGCLGDDVYSFDTCDEPVERIEICCGGCTAGVCSAGSSTASLTANHIDPDDDLSTLLDGDPTTGISPIYYDWQHVQIDFGCPTEMLQGFRRYMSKPDGMANRGPQGESIQYKDDRGEFVYFTTSNSSGWGATPMVEDPYIPYGDARRAWMNVAYGWSEWNCLNEPVAAGEVRFLWDGNSDQLQEVEFYFGDASPCATSP